MTSIPISSIYSQANCPAPVGEEAQSRNHAVFSKAWRTMGLIVIYPDQILDDWIRQAFINEATKQYGQMESR